MYSSRGRIDIVGGRNYDLWDILLCRQPRNCVVRVVEFETIQENKKKKNEWVRSPVSFPPFSFCENEKKKELLYSTRGRFSSSPLCI